MAGDEPLQDSGGERPGGQARPEEREAVSLPGPPSGVRFSRWPFVQRQDSGLWIREWWFESTRANWTYGFLVPV